VGSGVAAPGNVSVTAKLFEYPVLREKIGSV